MRRILVTDASVVVDLLARFAAEPIEKALFGSNAQLVAPELLDIDRSTAHLEEARNNGGDSGQSSSICTRRLSSIAHSAVSTRRAVAGHLAIAAKSNGVRRLLCGTGPSIGGNPGYPRRADCTGSGRGNQRRGGMNSGLLARYQKTVANLSHPRHVTP